MSRNYAQGFFEVRNPNKYLGKGRPKYRSGWEHAFMRFCDNNDSIVGWASESIAIPYRNPLTGKMTNYIPDFLITYRTKDNTMRAELIEIKPKGQSSIMEGQKPRERAVVAINYAKWASAQKWCKQHGLTFRVLTEDDLFVNGRK
jgi:hypothetical protein